MKHQVYGHYLTRYYQEKYNKAIQQIGRWIVNDLKKRAKRDPEFKKIFDETVKDGQIEAEVVFKWWHNG